MFGIFIYITGEEEDQLLSPGLNCRGCGQLQGVFPKCSDLIFGNVLGILCAGGLEVRAVQQRTEPDSWEVTMFSGTDRFSAVQTDSFVVLISFVFIS